MPSPNSAFSTPWVFLSYATKDTDLVGAVRVRLEGQGIRVWQDVKHMDAGVFLHTQIAEAISQVNHLVVFITHHSLGSEWVKKEIHLARRKRICILPIIGDDQIQPKDLPAFLSKGLCLTLEQNGDWERLIARLRGPCQAVRYAQMAPDKPAGFVPRRVEFDTLKSALLAKTGSLVALVGAGGFGKTWLATALCHDEEIQDRYSDDILWITLGERPTHQELLSKVGELIQSLTHDPIPIGIDASRSKLSELIEGRDILLVIDDVWRPEDLEPFLAGGHGTVGRLVTTRNLEALPPDSLQVTVDVMRDEEAVELLSAGLTPEGAALAGLQRLARQFGMCQ